MPGLFSSVGVVGLLGTSCLVFFAGELTKNKGHNTMYCFSVHQLLQKQASDDPINEKTTMPGGMMAFFLLSG